MSLQYAVVDSFEVLVRGEHEVECREERQQTWVNHGGNTWWQQSCHILCFLNDLHLKIASSFVEVTPFNEELQEGYWLLSTVGVHFRHVQVIDENDKLLADDLGAKHPS